MGCCVGASRRVTEAREYILNSRKEILIKNNIKNEIYCRQWVMLWVFLLLRRESSHHNRFASDHITIHNMKSVSSTRYHHLHQLQLQLALDLQLSDNNNDNDNDNNSNAMVTCYE